MNRVEYFWCPFYVYTKHNSVLIFIMCKKCHKMYPILCISNIFCWKFTYEKMAWKYTIWLNYKIYLFSIIFSQINKYKKSFYNINYNASHEMNDIHLKSVFDVSFFFILFICKFEFRPMNRIYNEIIWNANTHIHTRASKVFQLLYLFRYNEMCMK